MLLIQPTGSDSNLQHSYIDPRAGCLQFEDWDCVTGSTVRGTIAASCCSQLPCNCIGRATTDLTIPQTGHHPLVPDRTIAGSCELEQSETPDPGHRSYSSKMAIYLLRAERLRSVISSVVDRCVASSNALLTSSRPSSQTHPS